MEEEHVTSMWSKVHASERAYKLNTAIIINLHQMGIDVCFAATHSSILWIIWVIYELSRFYFPLGRHFLNYNVDWATPSG